MRSMANRLIEMWFSLSHYCHLWSIFFMKAIFSYVFPLCLGSKKHACYILISVIRNIESWSMAHNSHVNFLVEISFVAHYSLPIFTWHKNFHHFFFSFYDKIISFHGKNIRYFNWFYLYLLYQLWRKSWHQDILYVRSCKYHKLSTNNTSKMSTLMKNK